MRKENIPVAREGYPFIAYSAFFTLIAAVLGFTYLAILLLVVTTFVLMFFRDPERIVPEKENSVVSPADGKIIVVERVVDERFSKEKVLKISIFMNVFNVHVNRIPYSGTVDRILHVPGAFLAADHEKAHLKNEYCAVTITTDDNKKLTFVQIAGLVARRIVCRLDPADKVIRGERFGLIRFGSRVDVYLPDQANSAVKMGQKVRAGETILAYMN